MAKKKAKDWTDDDLKKLAGKLMGTCLNVFQVTRAQFGSLPEFTDAHWERMIKVANIFKCDECNEWQDAKEEKAVGDICNDCCNRIDGIVDELD